MKLIKKLDIRPNKTGPNKNRYGLFLCPYCGKKVERQLFGGKQQNSCGCIWHKIKHGDAVDGHKPRLYKIWVGMNNRCYNKNNQDYKYYGGRGISVYQSWKHNYVKFKDWALENGYRNDLTIDRIDSNKDYKPNNCKWSTRTEQMRNFRKNKQITFKNETHCISEWAEILGMNYDTLFGRLCVYSWSVERAFTEKVRKRSY